MYLKKYQQVVSEFKQFFTTALAEKNKREHIELCWKYFSAT